MSQESSCDTGHALLCSSARRSWQLRSAPLCTLRLRRSVRLRPVRPEPENSPLHRDWDDTDWPLSRAEVPEGDVTQ